MNGPVVLAIPPAPGSADPANLYVDLQSRALWLGVDPSVDPAGAVLISDIVQTQADIVTAEADAKAYTDEQIVTRAPVVHQHVAADITDFEAAVEAVVGGGSSGGFAIGMIMLWSGSLADIGVGALAGWHLCDGASGTPDLRDRFVIGAGNKIPGAVNPNTSFQTPAAEGAHAHTVGNTALTVAQMPSHSHSTNIAGRHYGGTYDPGGGQGLHSHSFDMWARSDSGSAQPGTWAVGGSSNQTDQSVSGGSHGHSVYVDISGSPSSDSKGSGAVHTHTLTGNGTHQHTITQANVRDVLPYYALAYIMKIA